MCVCVCASVWEMFACTSLSCRERLQQGVLYTGAGTCLEFGPPTLESPVLLSLKNAADNTHDIWVIHNMEYISPIHTHKERPACFNNHGTLYGDTGPV